MKKVNIMIWMQYTEETIKRLKSIPGVEVDILTGPGFDDIEAEGVMVPPERAKNIDILFCEMPFVNMVDFKQLKFIQISSTGYSQLYSLNLPQKGILACNGRGEFDTPIAEWCIAMMINLIRDMRTIIRHQESGIWDRSARHQTEIRGKRVGFFGYGSIAREAARLAKTMGMEVYAFDRERADFTQKNYYVVEGTGDSNASLPDKFFYPGQEKAFFSSLDFMITAMPLTPQTKGIVTEEMLRMLPVGAYVLNFARGELIQEQALLSVIRDGHLAGVALDAHYYYPMPADHPLWHFPNVIMTPHVSGSNLSPNFLPRIYDIFSTNVSRFLEGKPLMNQLTESQLNGN